MRGIIIISIFLSFCINFNAEALDLSKVDSIMPAYTVSGNNRNSINFYTRLTAPDNKIVLYCANWCQPSYSELNRLYSSGVIDSLQQHNYSLIIVSGNYPFLNLNSGLIEGDWNKRILKDFEIYYEDNNSILRQLSGGGSFPWFIIMREGVVVKESVGLKEDYSDIFPLIVSKQKKENVCPRCKGKGSVTPNPKSTDPDWCVGICPMCRGKGK